MGDGAALFSDEHDHSADAESDEALVSRVRAGDTDAFETLFERHRGMARNVAARHTDNYADAWDVVSDAFAAVFESLADGKGPNSFFRGYLLTIVRRLAYTANRAGFRIQPTEETHVLDSVEETQDPLLADFESTAVAQAFKALPERWQAVLWYVDIEGMKPAAASAMLGINPNGVSALAIRARERLRQIYLQQHITASTEEECRVFSSRLGAFARQGLSPGSTQKVQAHLEQCSKCTALLVDLDHIQSAMRATLFPLITGIAFISVDPPLSGAVAGGAAVDDSLGARLAPKPIPMTWKIPVDALRIQEDTWDLHLVMRPMMLRTGRSHCACPRNVAVTGERAVRPS